MSSRPWLSQLETGAAGWRPQQLQQLQHCSGMQADLVNENQFQLPVTVAKDISELASDLFNIRTFFHPDSPATLNHQQNSFTQFYVENISHRRKKFLVFIVCSYKTWSGSLVWCSRPGTKVNDWPVFVSHQSVQSM